MCAENAYKHCHIFEVLFENETKTPNAPIRFDVTGYEYSKRVLNNPCCVISQEKFHEKLISREINTFFREK